MRGFSISFRLAIWYASMSFAGIAIFGVVMWFLLAESVTAWKDRTLEMRASRVEKLLNSLPPHFSDSSLARLDELVGVLPEGQLIRIVGADGKMLFPANVSATVVSCPIPWIRGAITAKDGYRQLCHPVNYAGQSAYLLISSPLIEDWMLLSIFTMGLVRMVPLLLLASSVTGYLLGRRALRPVDLLTAEAQGITAMDLSRRLPVPRQRDELQRLAAAWNGLLDRLETAMKQIKQFTADASHELRNPIAYIRATAEFHLGNAGLDPAARQGFSEIVAETRTTGELLENLLTLARADAGQPFTKAEKVDVLPLLRDTCIRFQPLAEARQQTIVRDLPEQGSFYLAVDPSHFRRLVTILLDNAVKYTGPGGTIHVGCFLAEPFTLCVADNGIGISDADLPRIFDRFYRVDTARTDEGTGGGLGLAIAKWIVECYNGVIRVQSELGGGTRFDVVLPRTTN